MSVTLAYTSATGSFSRTHTRAWDAFDARILRAVEQTPGATYDDVVMLLPAGIHLRLIRLALRGLVADGLLEQGRTVADGRIVTTYTTAAAEATSREAA